MVPISIGFTGHQGLTPDTEQLIRLSIKNLLKKYSSVIGVCSLAEGSDQIFARMLLGAGGTLNVIIPCQNYEKTFKSPLALQTYRDLLKLAKESTVLNFPQPTEEAFWAAGKKVVEESDCIFAVWDGKPARGLGGTADVVKYAQKNNKSIEIIWPDDAKRLS